MSARRKSSKVCGGLAESAPRQRGTRIDRVATMFIALVLAGVGCRATGAGGQGKSGRGLAPGDLDQPRPPAGADATPAAATVGKEFVCRPDARPSESPLVRRLTVGEYVATVEAGLGVDVRDMAPSVLPRDLRSDGFTNTTGALVVTYDHVKGYRELARLVAARVPDLRRLSATLAGCADLEPACRRRLVDRLGQLLFRGPVRDHERQALETILESARNVGLAIEDGVRHLLEAMLQSPAFLYRIEDQRGGNGARRLSGSEMAARLSYLIWGAPPDDRLRTAAVEHGFLTDEHIEREARRMLDDPRAIEQFRRYVYDWLHLGRLHNLPRDRALYPDWDPELGAAMQEETLALFEHLWREDRPLQEAFNLQKTWLGPALARHYGLSGNKKKHEAYDLGDVPQRGGLLTHGSILAVGGSQSSMVTRGLFLLETFLCGEIEDTPPGVDTTVPDVAPGASQRVHSQARVDNPACAGCHGQIEPLAWGLERFDATGVWRTEDHVGNELREDGFILFPSNPANPGSKERSPFSTTAQMTDLLAGSERVRECAVLKYAQFAMGRPLAKGDGCSLAVVRQRLFGSRGSYRDLVVATVTSPMFQTTPIE
jgi:hypothetical protein